MQEMNSPMPSSSIAPPQDNPLLQPWTGPYGLPPFAQIKATQFASAFAVALAEHAAELDAIANQSAAPDFDNTLAAFDRSGRLLGRIETVFYALAASATSPDMQAAQRAMAAPLAAHNNRVYMHQALFKRVDALYQERQGLGPVFRATAFAGAGASGLCARRRQARCRSPNAFMPR